jgi:hypothetical protein
MGALFLLARRFLQIQIPIPMAMDELLTPRVTHSFVRDVMCRDTYIYRDSTIACEVVLSLTADRTLTSLCITRWSVWVTKDNPVKPHDGGACFVTKQFFRWS